MRGIIIIWLLFVPLLAWGQRQIGISDDCAPIRNGKVCYVDNVDMDDMKVSEIYKGISQWAKNNYAKDIFLSNVVTNKKKHTIFVSSKVELLLNETDKTLLKYRLSIECKDGHYTATMTDISYEYDPNEEKKHENIPAEDVITEGGKLNKIALIKDPELFCNATYFFAEEIFGDIFNSLDEDMGHK